MIYVRLHGRLGNQLFEYAAARGLAARLGTSVGVDERMLHHMGDALARPHFQWKVQTPPHLPPDRNSAAVRYVIWRLMGKNPRFQRENAQSEHTFFSFPDNSYLHGYWQRPHYFAHIAPELRQELSFAAPATGENARLARAIQAQTSASVHVRRGDFVALGRTAPTQYYRRALAKLTEILGSCPHIFFFSDDPSWVRETLAGGVDCTVVDHNGPDADFEDLRLISLCHHNIISPSSFSWWGAWLNANPDKIVIGPGASDTSRTDGKGWYPPGWMILPQD